MVKLSPKKATTAASPAERKLMEQLEQMKQMMEQLKKQNEALQVGWSVAVVGVWLAGWSVVLWCSLAARLPGWLAW